MRRDRIIGGIPRIIGPIIPVVSAKIVPAVIIRVVIAIIRLIMILVVVITVFTVRRPRASLVGRGHLADHQN